MICLVSQESEKGVFGGQGQIIDGRVHLLELSNAELEAKYIHCNKHDCCDFVLSLLDLLVL